MGRPSSVIGLDHSRQLGDGGGLKERIHADGVALLCGTTGHPDTQDRVAAQAEEVIVNTNLGDPQDSRKGLGQGRFDFIARRDKGGLDGSIIRRRQGAAIQLAVGGKRHGGQGHKGGGYHVRRQPFGQVLAERLAIHLSNQIGD